MKRLVLLIFILCPFAVVFGKEYADSAIYQGLSIKVDIGNTIFEMTRSNADIQSYEMAANVRLKNRFFPTLEGGFVTAKVQSEGGNYDGNGGFLRAGLDIYPLKDLPDASHILVGLRYANAMQHYHLNHLTNHNTYWEPEHRLNLPNTFRFDCWFEIVASLNVQVYKNFYMGWCVRIKILFTEDNATGAGYVPTYIPGFGYRSGGTNYGFNYYVGVKI